MDKIIVIGAGLAGVEAAMQISRQKINVDLYEMRPTTLTPAHKTPYFAEMVCSNSLGSVELTSALGLIKEELKTLDSFIINFAEQYRVPSGQSFAVDRIKLAEAITQEIKTSPYIQFFNQEVTSIPVGNNPIIIATGPLTSDLFAEQLTRLTERKNLFFYDATSPIIQADSIDMSKVYFASRYQKGAPDFINIPLTEDQYNSFVNELLLAKKVEINETDKHIFYEGCLPIEEIARRGFQSLAFGPLKPVGLIDTHTGMIPYAVIQLRQDDLHQSFYQLVGFQTRLKWNEQHRIFQTLPGLEKAKFERYGRMHRNSYINAPLIINHYFQVKKFPHIFIAGQLSGVEGYVESIASGFMAGYYAARIYKGLPLESFPLETACGSLAHAISAADWKNFSPTKFTFGLLPPISKRPKKLAKQMKADNALNALKLWKTQLNF
jgi:methylenetetrahydrofolate--tRNA-(uracil-5-)-methyltransferase